MLTSKSPTAPTPLKHVALERFIQSASEGSEIPLESFRAASSLPDFAKNLRAPLRQKAESHGLNASPSVCRLIGTAYETEEHVDMSPFRSFPSTALCEIIVQLQKVGRMESLDVSNCSSLTGEALASVLNAKTELHTLYTLETPRIPLETVVSLSENSTNNIHTIYHTEVGIPEALDHPCVYYQSPIVGENGCLNFSSVRICKG